MEDRAESSISAGRGVEGSRDLELHEEEPVDYPHGQVLAIVQDKGLQHATWTRIAILPLVLNVMAAGVCK